MFKYGGGVGGLLNIKDIFILDIHSHTTHDLINAVSAACLFLEFLEKNSAYILHLAWQKES